MSTQTAVRCRLAENHGRYLPSRHGPPSSKFPLVLQSSSPPASSRAPNTPPHEFHIMCPTNSSVSICTLDPSYLVKPTSRLHLHDKCRDAIINAAVVMGIHPNKLDTDPFFILRTFAPLVHLDLEAYPACFRVRLKFLTAIRYCLHHAIKAGHILMLKDLQPVVQAREEELDTFLGSLCSPAPETPLLTTTPVLAAPPSHLEQADEPAWFGNLRNDSQQQQQQQHQQLLQMLHSQADAAHSPGTATFAMDSQKAILHARVTAVQEEMESVAKAMDACVNSMRLLTAELEQARKELGTGSGGSGGSGGLGM